MNHYFPIPPIRPGRRPATLKRQGGFTLIELAIVLVVIGLIVGATTIGKDVQRNAIYQRISSDYVQGWAIAYDRFYDGTGRPPGDVAAAPTGRVNAALNTELCGVALRTAMQTAGIEMPSGRAAGSEDRYVYLDSNGVPQELQVCFVNTNWSEPDATPGTYVTRPRNVMVLKNLTPALATLLDNSFDTVVDARFGKLRETAQANNIAGGVAGVAWTANESMAFGSNAETNLDESQIAVVEGLLKMTR